MKKEQKIKILISEIKATHEHLRRQSKFLQEVGENKQFAQALTNSMKALTGQLKLFMQTLNACTGRKVEVVAISDTHTSGWGVEMILPNEELELKTFRYVQVLDVKADIQAKKVANAASWKYFMAEDVDKYWTEVK
jgi:hypothetical protein